MKKSNIDNQERIPLSLRRLMLLVVLLAVIIAIVFSTGLRAKYVHQEENESLYVAENFYFESDTLMEPTSGKDSSYTLKEGVDVIAVKIRNYTDALRNSEVDIHYTVILKDVNGIVESKTGTLSKNQQSEEEIVFSSLSPGMYTVTATSKPYNQTLQGTFQVRDAAGTFSYTVNDSKGSPFLEVVVTSADYEGRVKVTVPSGVRPDNTDSLLADAIGNSSIIEMSSYGSYTFLYFKDDPSALYTKDDITVIKQANN